jgi:signal transduction histidine kinase
LKGYALTSANDDSERDPRDWRLLGSQNAGETWEVLDIRRNEKFGARFQRRVFSLTNQPAYSMYRLQIDSVRVPEGSGGAGANSVQLAEIEPLYAANDTSGNGSIVVTAQGENPPLETAEAAFDGDTTTKWLDFASEGNTNKSSWIQWQYVNGESLTVINSRWLREAWAQKSAPIRLQLEGVVVSLRPEADILGFLDETGFQLLKLAAPPGSIRPGDRVRIAGRLEIGNEMPEVLAPRLTKLGPGLSIPELHANEEFPPGQKFLLTTASGKATFVSGDSQFVNLQLSPENKSGYVTARIFCQDDEVRSVFRPGCSWRVQGVAQSVFNDRGGRVGGTIWVPDVKHVSLCIETDKEWLEQPEGKLADLRNSISIEPFLLRVRGVVISRSSGQNLVVGQDTNQLVVCPQEPTSFQAGSEVEAVGFVFNESGQRVMRLANVRPANQTAVSASQNADVLPGTDHPITQVTQIREWVKKLPGRSFPIKIRGIITYIDLGLGEFYLQDGENGIRVRGQLNAGLCPFLRQEGACVEMEGEATDDNVSSTAFTKILGAGRMPEAVRHSWDFLSSGKDDGRWIEVEGVVGSVEKQRLTLMLAGGQLNVWINELEQNIRDRLLGSLVRVRGVCAPILNQRNQRLGMRLLVTSGENIEIVKSAPRDPFDQPAVQIQAVMRTSLDDASLPVRMLKTAGVVTYKEPRLLFIQDGTDGLRVLLRQETDVMPGDLVEVAGLPEPDGFSPKLVQALARKLGRNNLPPAQPIDVWQDDSNNNGARPDAILMTIDALLLGQSSRESRKVLECQLEKTRQTFYAYLPPGNDTLPPVPEGSRVQIRGVFKARTDAIPDFGQLASSFDMYLNSPADIVVLQRPPWWTAQHAFWTILGLGSVLLLSLGWARLLRKQVQLRTSELREEVDEHKRTESKLEAEIVERKRMEKEIEKTHKELISVSRQAGMAEVATSVLHNVGNVLNSANVGVSVLAEQFRLSKVESISRVARLFKDHQSDLPDYLTRDPKGRLLPEYLNELGERLSDERNHFLGELATLTKHIDHIKEIVAMQQSYAKVMGVTEIVKPIDLAEDALRLNLAALERHGVKVSREYGQELPELIVEKHKALQILVNLIGNAKYACDEANQPDKHVVIRLTRTNDRVEISVIDNGVGIPSENLTRIFNHGFTTRKNGHGFGLHNGSLCAKEMGGELRAISGGPGQGAAFTLSLPFSQPRQAQQT